MQHSPANQRETPQLSFSTLCLYLVFPLEIGYPLQYTWASLMAQLVKSLPAVWETWVQSLAWEDPLEENMATHSDICAWRIPMDREAWWATVHVATESETPKHSSRIYIYSHH